MADTKKYFSNYDRCCGCPYYYGEIDECMYEEFPIDKRIKPKKCKPEANDNENAKRTY